MEQPLGQKTLWKRGCWNGAQKSHRRWVEDELEFWPRGTEVLKPDGHKPDWGDVIALIFDRTLLCLVKKRPERVQMEGFTVVWVYLSALQSPGAFSFPPFLGGAELLSEQISLICPQAGFDLSRCCLLSRWGIKGQRHNCRHLSSAGLLPWQFAYRRKCKQISQEALWLGNLPEILQASVRLRTSIVFLGIQVLHQCS